jgi:ribosomal protein L44E
MLSVRTIAEKIEALRLRCHWCGETIRPSSVNHYPHDCGILTKETFPKKAWVYFECIKCGYQWALWKLLNQVELSMSYMSVGV